MGEELAAQVRHAVMELDDVAPEEQEQVLAEFFGRGDRFYGGVEVELTTSAEQPSAPKAPSFDFLADVPPAAIADVLALEQPQTIAVVVAQVRPEIAAGLLEHLPPALATEALARMARLIMPVPEVLADLEAELRRRLGPLVHAGSGGSLAGVRAILASLPGQSRAAWMRRLGEHDWQLAARLESSSSLADRDEAEPGVLYRLEAQPAARQPPAPLVEFEDLAQLTDRDLARLALAADQDLLALALIDADPRLAQRFVGCLPGDAAALLRSRLSQPGPVRLKEIDEAQRQLADLARDLASRGEITLPPSRHFAAAA